MSSLITDRNIRDFVNYYITNKKSKLPAALRKVPIGQWDVSRVTEMGYLFYNQRDFNEDISNWNVSNVTNMASMFQGAISFNQDLRNWDVSRVTDMRDMFKNATNFNQDLSRWNVSNVTNMDSMFSGARDFNQDIGNWNVSNVTNMESMFNYAINFNQDLSRWNVSNVTNMTGMFLGARNFNQDIGNWDVSNVTNMRGMFNYAINFNQDLSRWNVSNVTNMTTMFENARRFSINPNWTIRPGTNTQNMFTNTAIGRAPQPPQPQQVQPRQQPRLAPQGRAFEIHNAFADIDFNKFMDIIKKTNKDEPLLKKPDKLYLKVFTIKPEFPLLPLATYIHTSPVEAKEPVQQDKKIKDISRIQQAIVNYGGYETAKPDIIEVMKFVMTQPTEYIDVYIDNLITDCMNAYEPGQPSCIKGMFERVFTTNKYAIVTLCADEIQGTTTTSETATTSALTSEEWAARSEYDHPSLRPVSSSVVPATHPKTHSKTHSSSCKPVYLELFNCFYPDVDLEKIMFEWYDINNMETGSSPLKDASEEERKENFTKFVFSKAPKANITKINEYIKKNESVFKTLILDIGLGKRRHRRNRRTRRTRKTAKKYSIKRRFSKKHNKLFRKYSKRTVKT